MARFRDYVAVRKATAPGGRAIWRLYAVRSNRNVSPCDALGDYVGHRGKGGLSKIYAQLSHGDKRVTVRRIVRGQVAFRVWGAVGVRIL